MHLSRSERGEADAHFCLACHRSSDLFDQLLHAGGPAGCKLEHPGYVGPHRESDASHQITDKYKIAHLTTVTKHHELFTMQQPLEPMRHNTALMKRSRSVHIREPQ